MEVSGKMSPYARVELSSGQKAQTAVHHRAGKLPAWEEPLADLTIDNVLDDTVFLEVLDKETFKADDIVGNVRLRATALCVPGGLSKEWFVLYYRGREAPAGQVRLSAEWLPE